MITTFKRALHVTGDLTTPPGSTLWGSDFTLFPFSSTLWNLPSPLSLSVDVASYFTEEKKKWNWEFPLDSYYHTVPICWPLQFLPYPYLKQTPCLCPRSHLLLPTQLCSSSPLPSPISTFLKFSMCKTEFLIFNYKFSLPAVFSISVGGNSIFSVLRSKTLTSFSSQPISNLSDNPVGSTLPLYPESDHFSPPPLPLQRSEPPSPLSGWCFLTQMSQPSPLAGCFPTQQLEGSF